MCDVKLTPTFKNLTKQLGFTAGKLALVATVALGSLTTLAPTPAYAGNGEFFGTLGGGLAGGFIGNAFGHGRGRTAATAGGAVIGAMLGNGYGHSVDNRRSYDRGDRYYDSGYSSSTVYYSEPAPQRVYYVPTYEQRVRTVQVVPQTTYVVDNSYASQSGGSYCREYNQGVTVGGRTQPSYGTACMQPDGSWKIQ